MPYEISNKLFPISHPYYYALKAPASKLLNMLFKSGSDVKGVLLVTQDFIERCVIALTFYCRAPIEGIVSFFDLVIGHHVCKGCIHEIRKNAYERAKEYDSGIRLENIQYVAMDEIFQQQVPILTSVDLEHGYVITMEATEDRTGETWKRTLDKEKEKGFQPRLCVSDGGSGLLNGIPKAFPEIEMQLDVFHSLRDLGKEVSKQERHALAKLTELCSLESRLDGTKVHKKTFEKYQTASSQIADILAKADTLNILFSWIREIVGFSGYGYSKSLELCNWILDEMLLLYPEHKKYLGAVEAFRRRVPSLLMFLRRLASDMERLAASFNADAHAFMLMYNQSAYPVGSAEYSAIEARLYRVFKNRLPDARIALQEILRKTYRASSMIENVNGRLRSFIHLKREVPDDCLLLIKVFFNTKKAMRSRNKEWVNTSAIDRLTGTSNPEFLDIVSAPLDYVA